jgi:hypothetical protein
MFSICSFKTLSAADILFQLLSVKYLVILRFLGILPSIRFIKRPRAALQLEESHFVALF